jgi:hypothetical protein
MSLAVKVPVVGAGRIVMPFKFFYWQQVGTGVLIFLVLAASFGKGARAPE